MVRLKALPSLAPLAGLIDWFSNHVRRGEHRGGMFVRMQGTNVHGQPLNRAWHMLAEGDDGPFIPAMAVEALVRRALQGQCPAPGARAALREIELSDYEKLFQKRKSFTGIRDL